MTSYIGPYALTNGRMPVLLAPMSGVTDSPFRKQAARFGATATITEMVAGDDLRAGRKEALTRIKNHRDNGPYVVQLVGREADALRFGAEIARENGADIIDINMGCPSRRVTGGLSGSALMRDLDHAERLIEAVLLGADRVPVTLKMRLGWDENQKNAPELAVRAEKLGVCLVTVHGRTRQQFYDGVADWAAIRSVTEAVSSIPVIANGDITDVQSVRQAMKESGAAGVMIGRAATGKAWLPSTLEAAVEKNCAIVEPPLDVQINSLTEQLTDSLELYGDRLGIRVIRKHIAAAFDHWAQQPMFNEVSLRQLKAESCRVDSPDNLIKIFDHVLESQLEAVA